MTFVFSFISVGFAHFRDKFAKHDSPQVDKAGTFCVGYILKLATMFLVMSMNFFVCMAVALGMTGGELFFDSITKKRKLQKIDERF